MASEQHRARVKQARHEWQERRIPFMRRQPGRLVFIDETSVKTNLTRLRGRVRRGQRLRMDAPFGGWGTQTFIAGLTSEELIAPWVIKGAMDGPAFATYVRDVLAPELAPGTVVILDNLATHRNVEAVAADARVCGTVTERRVRVGVSRRDRCGVGGASPKIK